MKRFTQKPAEVDMGQVNACSEMWKRALEVYCDDVWKYIAGDNDPYAAEAYNDLVGSKRYLKTLCDPCGANYKIIGTEMLRQIGKPASKKQVMP